MRVDEDQPWHPLYLGQPLWNFINACFFEYGTAVRCQSRSPPPNKVFRLALPDAATRSAPKTVVVPLARVRNAASQPEAVAA